jgi:DNA mismatch endonuclease (patch repair protein)
MVRSKKTVSYNMSRIRSEGTKLEVKLEELLNQINPVYVKHPKLYGKPDFAYLDAKIAIFADSEFWHGHDWENKKSELKTNQEFWIKKIERNMQRDREVTAELQKEGWTVIRLWGRDILKNPEKCKVLIGEALKMSGY